MNSNFSHFFRELFKDYLEYLNSDLNSNLIFVLTKIRENRGEVSDWDLCIFGIKFIHGCKENIL